MSLFLTLAEKIYRKLEIGKLFSKDPLEHLNCLMSMIRAEIKDTPCKLKYNFIDFEECLTKPSQQCVVKLDISLMPAYENKGEYILWLASFIERITVGGKPKFPPFSNFIFSNFKIPRGKKSLSNPQVYLLDYNAQLIVSYFKSNDYLKNNKLSY
ncbi:hypothetical protein KTI78_15800 [Acinetobacter sp. WU_MDCI_Abxe161]|jgi:hypothetical protein|uniref:hypothetical protein n=1 Tax=Acinetobacter sp. WU_MDCI_Abxe161 TaxID=2850074 RepID=UPI0021CDD7ED|nr:hypothetical protein [Acinetobacter sp. WU_MDCI_Abxe161]MCU4504620.1 hypothetical protein [Acinetobacter sp. WU_MDCI_Abxe161]